MFPCQYWCISECHTSIANITRSSMPGSQPSSSHYHYKCDLWNAFSYSQSQTSMHFLTGFHQCRCWNSILGADFLNDNNLLANMQCQGLTNPMTQLKARQLYLLIHHPPALPCFQEIGVLLCDDLFWISINYTMYKSSMESHITLTLQALQFVHGPDVQLQSNSELCGNNFSI